MPEQSDSQKKRSSDLPEKNPIQSAVVIFRIWVRKRELIWLSSAIENVELNQGKSGILRRAVLSVLMFIPASC